MKLRAGILGAFASAAVLGVGLQLGQSHAVTAPAANSAVLPGIAAANERGSGASSSTSRSPRNANAAGSFPVPTATSGGTGAAATGNGRGTAVSGTFTGTSVSTRFGDVQVKVTLENGSITDVTPLSLTDRDPKSTAISKRAAPILRSEVLAAQSARVDAVSGATYTSDAYVESLQAALDQAANA